MPNEPTEFEAEEIEKDQYLIFVVRGQEFGIQAMKVQEISRVLATTSVPNAPHYIEGIMNLRGRLSTVIDFRKRFGFEPKAPDEDTRFVIVEHGGFPVGIIVDSVEEVIRIQDEAVHKLSEAITEMVREEYVIGVGMLEKRLIILLDVEKFLGRMELIEPQALKQAMEETKKSAQV